MEKDELCKESRELKCEGEGVISKEMLNCKEDEKKKKDEGK